MSPEVIKGQKPTSKVDIWALGILLYQLAENKLPFDRKTDLEMLNAIKDSEPPQLSDTVPDLIRYLI